MRMALETLRDGGKPALARALSMIERAPRSDEALDLLDNAFADAKGYTIGITGPPGVGKSSMIDVLIQRLRQRDISVGVIAVDPSSARSGGALLGDRARFASVDPADTGVFTRSMASRGRLGGLADLVFPSVTLMRAVFDVVIVETVGVGQSEIDVAQLTDTTALCIQPASGDSLQFIKAGIMEIPDIIIVTKADIGSAARRAASDLRSALSVTISPEGSQGISHPVVEVASARTGEGVDAIVSNFISRINNRLTSEDPIDDRRHQALKWCEDTIRIQFGDAGLELMRERLSRDLEATAKPFRTMSLVSSMIEASFLRLDLS